MYHAKVNVNLMVESLIQIKSGRTINVDASAKHITHLKNIIFGILLHVIAKNGKYLATIIDNSVITCDEIIDYVAKLNDEETKTVTTSFDEKNTICKTQNFHI